MNTWSRSDQCHGPYEKIILKGRYKKCSDILTIKSQKIPTTTCVCRVLELSRAVYEQTHIFRHKSHQESLTFQFWAGKTSTNKCIVSYSSAEGDIIRHTSLSVRHSWPAMLWQSWKYIVNITEQLMHQQNIRFAGNCRTVRHLSAMSLFILNNLITREQHFRRLVLFSFPRKHLGDNHRSQ